MAVGKNLLWAAAELNFFFLGGETVGGLPAFAELKRTMRTDAEEKGAWSADQWADVATPNLVLKINWQLIFKTSEQLLHPGVPSRLFFFFLFFFLPCWPGNRVESCHAAGSAASAEWQ